MELFSGLRRRSPNPNSPYLSESPPLSTHIPSSSFQQNLSPDPIGYAEITDRYHRPSPVPSSKSNAVLTNPSSAWSPYKSYQSSTIRFVPSPSQPYPTVHLPFSPISYISEPRSLPISSPPPRAPLLARRQQTAPVRLDKKFLDKPVPPLPLNLSRGRDRNDQEHEIDCKYGSDDQSRTHFHQVHLSPSVGSTTSHHGSHENNTSSRLPTPRHGSTAFLPYFRNPFRASPVSRNWSRTTNPYILDPDATACTRQSSRTELPPYQPPTPSYSFHLHKMHIGRKTIEKGESGSAPSTMSMTRSSASTAWGVTNLTNKFPSAILEKETQWSAFKWALLFSVIMVIGYSIAGSIWAVVVLSGVKNGSQVVLVSDPDLVTYLAVACLLLVISGFIGLTGTLLNSRPILSFYNLLLWPCLLSICLLGYPSYKRKNLNLSGKLNQSWSQYLSQSDRLTIQGYLMCCGYNSPFHEATLSGLCYPRSNLPGCKASWMAFEAESLQVFYTMAFSIVPFHIIAIVIALLCSNHVDGKFGTGMTPLAYRLRPDDVRNRALAVLSTVTTRAPTIKRVETTETTEEGGVGFTALSSSRLKTHPRHWREVIQEPGPDGRALREAKERGLL